MRILIIEKDCPYCMRYFDIINRINAILPINKRVRVIDISFYNDYNIQLNPIIDKIKFDATPFLYLDGIVLEGAVDSYFIEGYLRALFKEEFLI